MLTHDESIWKRSGRGLVKIEGSKRDYLIGKRGEEPRKKSSFKNSPRLIIGLDPMSVSLNRLKFDATTK